MAHNSFEIRNIIRIVLLYGITLGEFILILCLAFNDHLYASYFTYLNKTVFMIMLVALCMSNASYIVFKWAISIILPFLFGTAFYVAVGVTIIVFFRPQLLIDDLYDNPGPEGVARVALFDWLFHQLPFFEAVIVTWCVYQQAACAIRAHVWRNIKQPGWRVVFIIVTCYSHAIFFAFYTLLAPWDSNYKLDPIYLAITPIAILIATLILSGILVFIMFYLMGTVANPVHLGDTLFVNAHPHIKAELMQEHGADFKMAIKNKKKSTNYYNTSGDTAKSLAEFNISDLYPSR